MDPRLTRALSHPSRVDILRRISARPASARQIAEESREPVRDTVYHISPLHEIGCIQPVDPAETDPSERLYEIAIPDSTSPGSDAIPSPLQESIWGGLVVLQEGAFDGNARRMLETIFFDEETLSEAREVFDEAARRLAAAKAAAAERLAKSREEKGPEPGTFPTFKPRRRRKRDT